MFYPLAIVTPCPSAPPAAASVARPWTFASDERLVEELRSGNADAAGAFYDRHSPSVSRILIRILGPDTDLADIHQEVFAEALQGIASLREPSAVKGWLRAIAVNTARTRITRRTRKWWMWLTDPDDLPEREAPCATDDVLHALDATYRLLDKLAPDERIAFCLRFIDGMDLTDVAAACSVSLTTIKRRLSRAEETFANLAKDDPALEEWMKGGSRWGKLKTESKN